MYLRIKAAGKYWRMDYRMNGKPKVLSLGVYPAVSLAKARQKRDRAKEQLADGLDPGTVKRQEKLAQASAAANTFEAVGRQWLEKTKAKRREITQEKVKTWLEKDVFPFIGKLPISEISPRDVLERVVRKIEARGAIDTAHKGVLSVSIAPDILVKTWNNDLSDLIDRTLIQPGTPLFEAASSMAAGQYVTFSGLLYRGSDGDCVKEASLTLKGKVTEPEFIFRFDKLARYIPEAPKASVAASQVPAQASVETVAPAVAPAAAPVVARADMPAAPQPSSPPQGQASEGPSEPPAPTATTSASSTVTEQAPTPSFDCSKAGSVIEQLICKDQALARLDVQLAQAYKAAVQQATDKAELKSEQLSWLKNRRNKCATADCVFAAYEERLAILRD
jgi:uncharacterized protein YecT (DUF1311 family)